MLKDIYDIAVNRGFFIPSFEPYGQVGGFYDYGPLGVLMRRKIINLWRLIFLNRDEIHEIETSMINIERMLQASGHVDSFSDPLVRCDKCQVDYRADKLLAEKLNQNFDGLPAEQLDKLIAEHKIACPQCKSRLESAKQFNLMFGLEIGATGKQKGYLRPETAQGLFVAFPRIYKTYGNKLPMGIAQAGRSFRNEISPRKGLTRMREFTQMEVEYFFDPKNPSMPGYEAVKETKISMLTVAQQEKGESKPLEGTADSFLKSGSIPNEIMAYFIALEQQFYELLGVPKDQFWFRELGKNERPHYSGGNVDMEVRIGEGVVETIGNAYRTDYDLSRHQEFSKQDMGVFIEERKEKIIPHVVEPSMGPDRLLYCILSHCFRDKDEKKEWQWFAFPPSICPYLVSVFPLMKKEELAGKAREVYEGIIKKDFSSYYSERSSIGKRYARADEVGTFLAITIDYQTLEDDTVTIRFRDSGEQVRVKVSELVERINQSVKDYRLF